MAKHDYRARVKAATVRLENLGGHAGERGGQGRGGPREGGRRGGHADPGFFSNVTGPKWQAVQEEAGGMVPRKEPEVRT
jgi:hypothetical protein